MMLSHTLSYFVPFMMCEVTQKIKWTLASPNSVYKLVSTTTSVDIRIFCNFITYKISTLN